MSAASRARSARRAARRGGVQDDPGNGTWSFVQACDAIPIPFRHARCERALPVFRARRQLADRGLWCATAQPGVWSFLNSQPTGATTRPPSRGCLQPLRRAREWSWRGRCFPSIRWLARAVLRSRHTAGRTGPWRKEQFGPHRISIFDLTGPLRRRSGQRTRQDPRVPLRRSPRKARGLRAAHVNSRLRRHPAPHRLHPAPRMLTS